MGRIELEKLAQAVAKMEARTGNSLELSNSGDGADRLAKCLELLVDPNRDAIMRELDE